MITPNEVRLGNIVLSTFNHKDKTQIVLDETSLSLLFRYGGNEFYPIALAHGILEKAGFKVSKLSHDNDYTVYELNEDTFYLEFDWRRRDAGYNPLIAAQEWESIGVNIKYLHELQNLFWCLCGEELKISLP